MEEDLLLLKPNSQVCVRHFPGGDVTKYPQANLGKRFVSPIKKKLPRARHRDSAKGLCQHQLTLPTQQLLKRNQEMINPR